MIDYAFGIITFTSFYSDMALSIFEELFTKCGVCVLLLVHSLYNFFSIVLECLLNIVLYFKTNLSRTSSPVKLIKDQVKCYHKIPKHIAFIIEEEDISYHDCIKLMLWCIHSEITFVSFYSFSSGE